MFVSLAGRRGGGRRGRGDGFLFFVFFCTEVDMVLLDESNQGGRFFLVVVVVLDRNGREGVGLG